MNTHEIATRLVEYCRKGDFETAQDELYSEDAISLEPYATPDFPQRTEGLNNIRAKLAKFRTRVREAFGNTVSEPLVTANSIAFILTMDVQMEGSGRQKLAEMCLYQVKDGKIISEQFFM